jgi:hypothetical protein
MRRRPPQTGVASKNHRILRQGSAESEEIFFVQALGTAFANEAGMSLCASCGLQLTGDAALCPHHHCVYGDDWAVANRIMCDFFHRGKVPSRLMAGERDDDFWAHASEAA